MGAVAEDTSFTVSRESVDSSLSTDSAANLARLFDLIRPFCGECGICGCADQRHRMYDSLHEAVAAGDSPSMLAWAYEMPQETIEAIAAGPKTTRRLIAKAAKLAVAGVRA